MAKKEELEKVVEAAQRAYDAAKGSEEERRKKYLETIALIEPHKKELVNTGLGGPALKTWGWAAYYLGNLDNPHYKEMKIDNLAYYREASTVWEEGLELTNDPAVRISILNGLPLSERWLYPMEESGKFARGIAFLWSGRGIEEAKITGKPEFFTSAQNTRNILLKEQAVLSPSFAKDFLRQAAEGCQEVYQVAYKAGAYRTAGHGQQNLGDTYVLMIHITRNPLSRINLAIKAFHAYWQARGCYVRFERETGEKAAAHYQAATKKMLSVVREIFR